MSAWHPSIKSPPVAPDLGGVVRGKRREKRKPNMDKTNYGRERRQRLVRYKHIESEKRKRGSCQCIMGRLPGSWACHSITEGLFQFPDSALTVSKRKVWSLTLKVKKVLKNLSPIQLFEPLGTTNKPTDNMHMMSDKAQVSLMVKSSHEKAEKQQLSL